MKSHIIYFISLIAFISFSSVPVSYAQESDEEIQEEIEQEEKETDQIASTSEGQQRVEQKIKDQFLVNDELISDLREKKFGYGEITTTLALAQHMEGGINDENIQKIVDMRKGEDKTGWGNIAKQFDVKVGDLRKGLHQGQNPSPDETVNTPSEADTTSDNQNLEQTPPTTKGSKKANNIEQSNQKIKNNASSASQNASRGPTNKPPKVPKGK